MFRFPAGLSVFFSLKRPDQLRGTPSLLFNGYQGPFQEVKLTHISSDLHTLHTPSQHAQAQVYRTYEALLYWYVSAKQEVCKNCHSCEGISKKIDEHLARNCVVHP